MNAKILPFLLSILLLACGTTFAGTIPPEEAKEHVGQTVTVRGQVEEFHAATRAYFLNMGGRYPHETFSVVCFSGSAVPPDDLSHFEGKTISVTGKVKLFHGRVEIILNSLDQISEH